MPLAAVFDIAERWLFFAAFAEAIFFAAFAAPLPRHRRC